MVSINSAKHIVVIKYTATRREISGTAPSASRCPPAPKSCGSRRCSSAALWRRAPAVGSVLVWNTPALPGWWPHRPHRPGRLRSCVNQPKVHRGRWREPGGSCSSRLKRAPPPPLLHLFGWGAGWGNCGLSSWPAGWRRRSQQPLPPPPAPPRWNELLNQALLTRISLPLQNPEESTKLDHLAPSKKQNTRWVWPRHYLAFAWHGRTPNQRCSQQRIVLLSEPFSETKQSKV